jgi:trans-aconitate 2-methyltransferase
MSAREWDGAAYDRVSTPQQSWGLTVLERLPLNGNERVLDAGCGSGRVTQALIERLPRGRVIAVDGSPSMIAAARERLGPRADLRVVDLLELELEQPVDAVLSTATFHWIADHEQLYRRLHAALRPGGRLVAQCGGEGNVERVHRAADLVAAQGPFAEHLAGWRGPWNFTSPTHAEATLRTAGFREAHCWLVPAPVTPSEPREFMRTVILGAHLDRLPADLHDPFVAAVHERLGDPLTIDYVRLNIDATA